MSKTREETIDILKEKILEIERESIQKDYESKGYAEDYARSRIDSEAIDSILAVIEEVENED